MAYTFERDKTAKFKFRYNRLNSATITLNGINATLPSADTICDGICSLVAVVNTTPTFVADAVRTSTETVKQE